MPREELVFADADGVLFRCQRTSRASSEMQRRHKLREQLQFDEHLARRSADPSYSLRQHVQAIGGAIEE